jgi:hypothetical protein
VDELFEDPLISILSLLADVHLVGTVFGPLDMQASSNQNLVTRSPAGKTVRVPFTPGHEINRLRQKLSDRLVEWKNSHLLSVSKDVALLYHFCCLYSLVPTLPSLFTLSRYARPPLSSSGSDREYSIASQGLPSYRAAMSTVWHILETSERMQSSELPIWAPLSVFSAGLVIWARKKFAMDYDVDSWSARSLHPFQQELAKMKFSGAQDMAAIIANLGQKGPQQV